MNKYEIDLSMNMQLHNQTITAFAIVLNKFLWIPCGLLPYNKLHVDRSKLMRPHYGRWKRKRL